MYVNQTNIWKIDNGSLYECFELKIKNLRKDKFIKTPSDPSIQELLKNTPDLAMLILSFGHETRSKTGNTITEPTAIVFTDYFIKSAKNFPKNSLSLTKISRQVWMSYIWYTKEFKTEHLGYYFPRNYPQSKFEYENLFGETIVKNDTVFKGLELFKSKKDGIENWVNTIRESGLVK
ncbi:MAG TPA: hypothetical protein PKJ33_01775 [Alphaproteobacteria bacterium]|nr:hypothetical protein [Alphaproteobacteria bacterium]